MATIGLLYGNELNTISESMENLEIEKTSEKPKEAVITAVGDVTLGYDGHHLEPILERLNEEDAFNYPFANVRDNFQGVVFCNLEGTLTIHRKRLPKKFNFKADPKYIDCLTRAGIDIVSIANNHTMDYCTEGLEETIETLDSRGIKHAGAGINLEGARKEVYINENGLNICFIAYSMTGPEQVFAGKDKAGTSGSYSKDAIKSFIEEDFKRARQNSDFIITSFHWGIERQYYPTAVQKELARHAIDNGANVVLGHHPHVLQGIEEYNNGIIFYSLGNFMFSGNSNPSDKDSIIAKILIDENGLKDYSIIPVKIRSHNAPYQPFVLKGEERRKVVKRLNQYSSDFKHKEF